MIAYLDTHIAALLAGGDRKRMARKVQRALDQYSLLISPMAVLELEYLHEIRRIKIPGREVLLKLEQELHLQVSDLAFSAVAEVALGESWTRDPFDRVIVAQAKANGFAYLISNDENIAAHYPRTIW